MHYGILGSLELSREGQTVAVSGAKRRALLAMLLIHANRVVSTERLIDALWEEQPPDAALKTLQVHVSQLRKLVGEGQLETRSPGYLLHVQADALDLERFERLCDAGELDEALSLWRGPPLADFEHQRFAQAEIARLSERRLGCLEERTERRLAEGRHHEVVGELEALVNEYPAREQLRCQLMLALYRAGRQAEALDSYQQARSALVEELGLEPGRALRALHQAILNQDPALEIAPSEQPSAGEAPPGGSPAHVAESVDRDVRKTITAAFVGIGIASTSGDELDPEALRQVTGVALREVEAAVQRHGGAIETVTSDSFVAVFGLPTVHEDDALRGVRAAAEIRYALSALATDLVAERGLTLDFRIGISTGEVVTSFEGGAHRRTTGEPLTISTRLSQTAAPGEIVFHETVRRLVRDDVVAEEAGDGWRLLDIVAREPSMPRRLNSPMVGRERERRRLHDSFEQAVGDRSCQLFTVLGLAGVGKSRLVQELLDGIAGRALVVRGRCLPYGEGITYWPLLEVVKEAVGLDDTDTPDQARAKLLGALDEERDAELVAHRVAEMIGLAEVTVGIEEGFVAVRALVEALARTQPLVIVFDDVHWGEPTFLDLAEHLADWVRDVPVLLVCLARPELLTVRPSWGGGKLNATVALLEPLSHEQCALLIHNLIGVGGLTKEIDTSIAEAAEGNPLFVEEMLSMLIDDGLLVRENGHWSAIRDIAAVRVPPTIQALLAARLDQLGETERAVIEWAAIAGKVFQEGAILELAPENVRPAVADVLGSLVRKDLIRPERVSLGDRTYRFRHLLIRDAAYESLPKESRAELHKRYGWWLERTASERATEYEEVVGYHLEQSHRYRIELGPADDDARAVADEAARRLGNAGRRAFIRSDAPAGANLISRAVALLPRDDPRRVELIPNVRAIQGTGGDMNWADRVLTDAVEAAATTGDRGLAAHALVQRALLRLFTEPSVTPGDLLDVAERSISVFDALGDELGLARAWRLKGQAHYLARRADACAQASEQALEHVRRSENRFEEQEIVEWLLIALLLGPATAEHGYGRCRRLLAETADLPLLHAQVMASMGSFAAMQGQLAEAEELAGRSKAVMAEAGQRIWILSFWDANTHLWQGDGLVAERLLRPGYEALKTLGEKSHFTSIAHALADALYLQGRYDEAEQLTRECEQAARPNDVHAHILWRSTRAKVLARQGAVEMAEQLSLEAVAFAATTDFSPAHADALLDLAEVLDVAGRPEEARATTAEAVHLLELKGNALAAGRARFGS